MVHCSQKHCQEEGQDWREEWRAVARASVGHCPDPPPLALHTHVHSLTCGGL